MNTLGEIRQALIDDLSVETSDTFYPTALLNRYINRAYRTVANLYPWQETQAAKVRDTIANQEYLTYPENLRTDSVFLVRIDGEEYKILTFREYQRFKEEYPNNTEKRVSDWQRKLFIHPTPTTAGTANVEIWGNEVPAELTTDSDEIIFANQSVLEEAIFMYAQGMALMKGRGTNYERGKALLADALTMARNEWDAQRRRQAEYQTETTVMFEHYDYLHETARTKRGTFETC